MWFSLLETEWRKPIDLQNKTWQRDKSVVKSLGFAGANKLLGCGPRNPPCAGLDTLQDMASNRTQWRTCCQFLSRSSDSVLELI